MSKNVKLDNVVNNSNNLSSNTFNLFNDWKMEVSNETIVRGTIPFKSKVINAINKEIKLINDRKDLNLMRIMKKVKGETIEVNENRFWKHSIVNPNTLLVSVKVKGKIVNFNSDTNTPNYFMCQNEKDSLINLLSSIRDNVEKLDVDHILFKSNE